MEILLYVPRQFLLPFAKHCFIIFIIKWKVSRDWIKNTTKFIAYLGITLVIKHMKAYSPNHFFPAQCASTFNQVLHASFLKFDTIKGYQLHISTTNNSN